MKEVTREGGVHVIDSAEWMLTMNSHGVEISIAGCVEEMVRGQNPKSFFLCLFFSFLSWVHCF